jgi:hypothetical protein
LGVVGRSQKVEIRGQKSEAEEIRNIEHPTPNSAKRLRPERERTEIIRPV